MKLPFGISSLQGGRGCQETTEADGLKVKGFQVITGNNGIEMTEQTAVDD